MSSEIIKHPPRYVRNGIEVWDIEKAFQARPEDNVPPFAEHLRLGAVEYLLRCWDKGGTDDIRKARALLDRMIEEMEVHLCSSDS